MGWLLALLALMSSINELFAIPTPLKLPGKSNKTMNPNKNGYKKYIPHI